MDETVVVGGRSLRQIVAAVGVDVLVDEMIEGLRSTIASADPDLVETRDRDGFRYDKPDLGLIEWMPTLDTGRRVAIKTVAYHPTNPLQRAVPSVLGSIALYDCATGHLDGLVEGTIVTALRTGVASAVASDALAPERPLTLSVIGCGAQAVTQIHALSRVRTIERILAYDVVDEVAESLARRCRFVDAEIELVAGRDRARLLSEADVLCTCTSVPIGEGPVIDDGLRKSDLHVNAVGADFPGKLELPATLLDDAVVFPDVRTQCLLEGECQQLAPTDVGPDLRELVLDEPSHSRWRHGLSVFDSTGWALEDMVAAEVVLGHALRLDVGDRIDLQSADGDPYDPLEGMLG